MSKSSQLYFKIVCYMSNMQVDTLRQKQIYDVYIYYWKNNYILPIQYPLKYLLYMLISCSLIKEKHILI